MNKEVSKWLTANTNRITSMIIGSIVINNSGYSNLIELVRNLTNNLRANFLLLKTSDIPLDKRKSLPPKLLCFNANYGEIISESVKFIEDYLEAFKYDYVILYDNNDKASKVTLKEILLFLSINKIYFIVIFFSFLAFFSIRFPTSYLIIIPFQIAALILLYKMNEEFETISLKKFCSIGAGEKDKCSKLKRSVPRFLNLFDFSELGVIYFLALLTSGTLYLNFPNSTLLSTSILMLLFIGVTIIVYSSSIQLLKRIACPVCIFVSSVLLFQFLFISKFLPSLQNLSLLAFVFTAFLLLAWMMVILDQKIIHHFKRNYFTTVFDFKELLIGNLHPIIQNFEDGSEKAEKLLPISTSSKNIIGNKNLILCLGLECNSCLKLIDDIKNLDYSHYNLNVIFYLSKKGGSIENNPYFESNVLLSIVLNKYGFLAFSEVLREAKDRNLDIKFIAKYLKRKGLEVPKNKFQTFRNKLIVQNKMINTLRIEKFPFIILKNKIIPSFFKSHHYDLFKF